MGSLSHSARMSIRFCIATDFSARHFPLQSNRRYKKMIVFFFIFFTNFFFYLQNPLKYTHLFFVEVVLFITTLNLDVNNVLNCILVNASAFYRLI